MGEAGLTFHLNVPHHVLNLCTLKPCRAVLPEQPRSIHSHHPLQLSRYVVSSDWMMAMMIMMTMLMATMAVTKTQLPFAFDVVTTTPLQADKATLNVLRDRALPVAFM